MKKVIVQAIVLFLIYILHCLFTLYASVESYFLNTNLVIYFLSCIAVYYYRTYSNYFSQYLLIKFHHYVWMHKVRIHIKVIIKLTAFMW